MTTKKDQILKAMRIILQEYEERTHIASIGSCELCILFYTEDRYTKASSYHPCHKCPMFVFHKDADLACLKRKCQPIYCRDKQRPTKGLYRVREFYERVIAKVESMTNDEVCKPRAWEFMIDIDKEVAEKYKVVKATE